MEEPSTVPETAMTEAKIKELVRAVSDHTLIDGIYQFRRALMMLERSDSSTSGSKYVDQMHRDLHIMEAELDRRGLDRPVVKKRAGR